MHLPGFSNSGTARIDRALSGVREMYQELKRGCEEVSAAVDRNHDLVRRKRHEFEHFQEVKEAEAEEMLEDLSVAGRAMAKIENILGIEPDEADEGV